MKVFDKAKWHYEGHFPKGLDQGQAFIHTGYFLGWLVDARLLSEEFADDFDESIAAFRCRQISGPRLFAIAGGVLSDDMLNDEGAAFAASYYDLEQGHFMPDYERLLVPPHSNTYEVADSWANYEKLVPVISARFAEWKTKR